jgi:tetratricopeptide (TPR) repeat protein
MKIAMNLPNDHQYSIMQRILDGTLTIESVEEFKEILDIYPDDPILRRKYADLLVERSQLDQAIAAFGLAAELFIDQGMNLQAIVAKILQWSIEEADPPGGPGDFTNFCATRVPSTHPCSASGRACSTLNWSPSCCGWCVSGC